MEAINNGAVTDFYLDFKLALAKPTVTRTKELKSVDVKVHSFTPRGYTESIFDSGMVEVHGETVIQANYNPAIDISAEITGGTLVSAEYYARTAFVRVSGDGVVNVVLTGRMLDETQSTVSVKENNTGDICPMDNPLITDAAVAQDVGEWVGRYLRNRNSYETNFRQDFRLDANDMKSTSNLTSRSAFLFA